jgi:hypothetical protein
MCDSAMITQTVDVTNTINDISTIYTYVSILLC